MRWPAFAAIAAFLAAVGALAVVQERDDDQDQATVREFPEGWRLVDVGADGRSLRLAYDGGGCKLGNGRAIVRESRSAVRIEVRQGRRVAAKSSSVLGCTLDLKGHSLIARLDRPIAGRHVEGSAPINSFGMTRVRRRGDGIFIGVPRVVGLSGRDAVELLGYQLFRPRLRGASVGQVISQRPKPGTPIRLSDLEGPFRTVTLTLHRHPRN